MRLRGWVLAAMAVCGSAAGAQQARGGDTAAQAGAAQLQLSPQAAFAQAQRPLDIVRNAMSNWSEAEKNALGVAVSQAGRACDARHAEQYAGDDLLAFVQLCNFGWRWKTVQLAAQRYIDAKHQAPPEDKVYTVAGLTEAYAFEIKASLSLKDDQKAFECSQALLREAPYTAVVSSATTATMRYIQIIHTEQARALAAQRYLLLLDLIGKKAGGGDASSAVADPAEAIPALHTLYEDALAWPEMMEFNKSIAPEKVAAELDAALPAKLSDDDSILIAAARRRYGMLGAPLPRLAASAYLADAQFVLPEGLNRRFGTATAFLLFPDWCSQCVGLNQQFSVAAVRLNKVGANFFAVLAQDGPPPVPPPPLVPVAAGKGKPATASVTTAVRAPRPAEMLVHTPTLVVPASTVRQFEATDFPWLIVTDSTGVVRFMQAAPENVLEEHSLLDQVVERVMKQWPAGAAEDLKP